MGGRRPRLSAPRGPGLLVASRPRHTNPEVASTAAVPAQQTRAASPRTGRLPRLLMDTQEPLSELHRPCAPSRRHRPRAGMPPAWPTRARDVAARLPRLPPAPMMKNQTCCALMMHKPLVPQAHPCRGARAAHQHPPPTIPARLAPSPLKLHTLMPPRWLDSLRRQHPVSAAREDHRSLRQRVQQPVSGARSSASRCQCPSAWGVAAETEVSSSKGPTAPEDGAGTAARAQAGDCDRRARRGRWRRPRGGGQRSARSPSRCPPWCRGIRRSAEARSSVTPRLPGLGR
mmetsp:Transcript_85972/g.216386  ORF Transcript_85972/g.216386 Transcript_85972/m.216386 type:complete len:287 (+) Transcript_85972:248-1108(+)